MIPVATVLSGSLLAASACFMPLQDQAADDRTAPPLDPRIEPAKITELDPAPLPEQVVIPLPPSCELATSPDEVSMSPEQFAAARAAIDRGVAYLLSQQDSAGYWMQMSETAATDQAEASPVAIAVTAMATKAIVQADRTAIEREPMIAALRAIARARRDDGSFVGGKLSNYVTSAVVSALAASQVPEMNDMMKDGVVWLTEGQWDEGEGLTERQDWYGGAGYGNHGRPDLSNTQTMLDALYDAGMSPDEPAYQRAAAFASRAQNFKQTNPAPWAGDDGGFIYTPANGGESMASEAAGEGRYGEIIPDGQARSLRSYGSMTYAGFKSLLYAGLSPDDVRVRAAFDWIRSHWTFDENPGLGAQGHFYYLHAMSRALRVAQQDEITDKAGASHNWRNELVEALVSRQAEDGSWTNTADRWLEGEPVMATIYAVLALEEALKP